jgi:dynein heavy chain
MPLPLPQGIDSIADASMDGDDVKMMVHSFESAVIEWTRLIRTVLKRDSAQPLIEGKHPGALFECDFWVATKKNAESLQQQLTSEPVQQMQQVLDDNKSSYGAALTQLQESIAHALAEANDIVLHLEPLRVYVEQLEDVELEAAPRLMKSIFATLRLIWTHSTHYNTARRMVVVLREICNQLINTIVGHIEPRNLFAQEPEEGIEKPLTALKVIAAAEAEFDATRQAIFVDSQEGKCNPWAFERQLVFARLDSYKGRIQKLHEVFQTFADFIKLEKVEVSGEKVSLHDTPEPKLS